MMKLGVPLPEYILEKWNIKEPTIQITTEDIKEPTIQITTEDRFSFFCGRREGDREGFTV